MKVLLFSDKIEQLQKIWFMFGNHGKKTTNGNHKLIQHLLEENGDAFELIKRDINFYKKDVSDECLGSVIRILLTDN